MKKHLLKLTLLSIIFIYAPICLAVTASDCFRTGNDYFYKATIAMTLEEKNYYSNKALDIFQKEYEKDNTNINIMVALGRTYCLLEEKTKAKNILMQAYNTYPNDTKVHMALGDYNYYFQEYNTALEFYKLALSSGLLKDYKTNTIVAMCYEKLGDEKNAKLYYNITNMLNPNYQIAKQKLYSLENKEPIGSTITQNTIFQTEIEDSVDINEIIENTQHIR